MSATRGKEESRKLILLEVETIEWKLGGEQEDEEEM